jgi:hypothetical protein
VRLGIKITLICLWFVLFPVLIFLALNNQFYFINNTDDFIIWFIIIFAFFIVFSIAVLFGFRKNQEDKTINIEYEDENVKKLFELAHKYHLDLEINDALKIYEEIIEKYPNTIYEKEAKIEINRIKGNKLENNANLNEKALQILYERYAKGEITKIEFIEMKKTIK